MAEIVVLPQKVPPPLADTADGVALTVTTDVTIQEVGVTYDTLVVPAVSPANAPDVEFIVPTDVVLLVHVPPETLFDNAKVLPVHTDVPPVIGAVALTVTNAVELHPEVAIA